MSEIKHRVFEACRESVQKKVDAVHAAIRDAQQSANEETKSSAGDKYETGRAMAQLEIEKLSAQLSVLQKQMQEVLRSNPDLTSSTVVVGSLVHTDQGMFFIATNVGELAVEGKKVFAISPQAPLAQKMLGCCANDVIDMNGRHFRIDAIE